MASEPLRPGGPSGLEQMLKQQFHVPATPTILREEAARLVLAQVAALNIRCGRLDVSDQPVRRGALFDAAGTRVPFPPGDAFDRCFIALVDPEPTTRWGHPAHWAFVPADGQGDVVLQDTELPENATGSVRLLPMPMPITP